MGKAIKIKETQDRLITPSGLLLVGALLMHTTLGRWLNRLGKPKELKHKNANCVIPYIGLLCQGKTEYEDIRELQEDSSFSCQALHINTIPSVETVRQRLDYLAFEIGSTNTVMEESVKMLKATESNPTATFTGHIPLDIDVSPHDNSNTKKEGVSRTYKGMDGYSPIYAYIGQEGYACNGELRDGTCHSQCEGTLDFLKDTLQLAKQITSEKLLVRMDSGNDSLDNIKLFIKEKVDYIIKRNLRKESKDEWLKMAKMHGKMTNPRDGKTVYIGEVLCAKNIPQPLHIVFEITVRTMLANGQILIIPEIDVATWWTSLNNSPEEIIKLYHEHATCEQFHSEIKSDIGLERFPSGKFDTNAAILKLTLLAYNILRIVGQNSLHITTSRKNVKRLRAKTVIQRFMTIAGRVITHARQIFLTLGRSNIWRDNFTELYATFT
ncbi:MAG: IS1380 family transposase [Oscillospiraceae bacterium]|nr:IS1380 family transposase [Oscillospiraceae bacterium]